MDPLLNSKGIMPFRCMFIAAVFTHWSVRGESSANLQLSRGFNRDDSHRKHSGSGRRLYIFLSSTFFASRISAIISVTYSGYEHRSTIAHVTAVCI